MAGDAPCRPSDPTQDSDADLAEVKAARRPTYAAGDVIASKYRLEHVLGEGGMGSVWRARNLVLDVDVAIKLALGAVASATVRARLLREAQTAARLQHASIVRIYDFGETSFGDPFIVMEVVRGESLAAILDRRGRLTAVEAVKLLLPIASALSVAHRKGIVHRDVKPSNIIVTAGDRSELLPKLVDFGIAHVETRTGPSLTGTGVLLGSPDYMAPEQIRARVEVDERADVWALGVVLYEAVAGCRPFGGTTMSATLGEILVDEPTPLPERGAGDLALWSIIALALRKNREDRWSTTRAMGRALARWARSAGAEADATGTLLEGHWLSEGDDHGTWPPIPALAGPSTIADRVGAAGPPAAWPVPPSPPSIHPAAAYTDDELTPRREPVRRRAPLAAAAGVVFAACAVTVWVGASAGPDEPRAAQSAGMIATPRREQREEHVGPVVAPAAVASPIPPASNVEVAPTVAAASRPAPATTRPGPHGAPHRPSAARRPAPSLEPDF